MTETEGSAGPDRLAIVRTTVDGIRVITLRGEIDHDTAGGLRQALLPGDGAVPQRTVIDLSAVTFMDSSGINTLITAHRAAQGDLGWLRLVGPTEPVRRVMQIVGLDTVIACYPTLREALST
ncbi:STAS domain-containing protein [Streptomyces hygroscopicus]|uniref:STAS domain-containing protein n=1 Tax=Streptomyces hygroscopicus TaxID=1912 RepID=UPI00223EE698|nr:STAS domain-containing protein [Streptomyces hygroscopicus]